MPGAGGRPPVKRRYLLCILRPLYHRPRHADSNPSQRARRPDRRRRGDRAAGLRREGAGREQSRRRLRAASRSTSSVAASGCCASAMMAVAFPADELPLAISRHATSKIASLDDLENVATLGFRGEALPSIGSVSRLRVTSKPADARRTLRRSTSKAARSPTVRPAAHPAGTTMEVRDLFYNVPARRKFVRSDATEVGHIARLVERLALSRFDVTFKCEERPARAARCSRGGRARRSARYRAAAPGMRAFAACWAMSFWRARCRFITRRDRFPSRDGLGCRLFRARTPDQQFWFVNGRIRARPAAHECRARRLSGRALRRPPFGVRAVPDARSAPG